MDFFFLGRCPNPRFLKNNFPFLFLDSKNLSPLKTFYYFYQRFLKKIRAQKINPFEQIQKVLKKLFFAFRKFRDPQLLYS